MLKIGILFDFLVHCLKTIVTIEIPSLYLLRKTRRVGGRNPGNADHRSREYFKQAG